MPPSRWRRWRPAAIPGQSRFRAHPVLAGQPLPGRAHEPRTRSAACRGCCGACGAGSPADEQLDDGPGTAPSWVVPSPSLTACRWCGRRSPTCQASARACRRCSSPGCSRTGRRSASWRRRVAQRCGIAHAVAVASCTSGLMLVYQALGATGRVVIPSFTFAASAHAVRLGRRHGVGGGGRRDDDAGPVRRSPGRRRGGRDERHSRLRHALRRRRAAGDRRRGLGVPLVFDAAHALGSRRAQAGRSAASARPRCSA